MPIYEYECSNCKFYIEALQKITDKPLKECPSCKKQTLKKLVSAPVFRLKGGGWYETDFKSDKEEKRNLAEREEAAESKKEEAKSEAGKEEKPAEAKPVEAKPAKPAAAGSTTGRKPKLVAKPVAKAVARPKAKARPAAKKPAKKKRR